MTECAHCGRPFQAKRSTARYCSDRCKKRAQRDVPLRDEETSVPLSESVDVPLSVKQQANAMLEEARTLVAQQPRPYVRTHESEARAMRVLSLRKGAASLLYPLRMM